MDSFLHSSVILLPPPFLRLTKGTNLTYFYEQGVESGNPEIATQSQMGGLSTSGGGFSTHFGRPSYQNSAAAGYFNRVSPYPGYAAAGRGYPDLAVASVNYIITIGGTAHVVAGTSACTPVIAGIISLVNAARFRAGLSPVGWFHPILYNYHSLFTRDVTSGNNSCTCCSPNPVCCSQGFAATTGWDPVTGFGSIDVRSLLQFMINGSTWTLPTDAPTRQPTLSATKMPTLKPTITPTLRPTPPQQRPSQSPIGITQTKGPTRTPTTHTPIPIPTRYPTNTPTITTSKTPPTVTEATPSCMPSVSPTATPSLTPTSVPSSCPSALPTATPSGTPSVSPTATPSLTPTSVPSSCPSALPTATPSGTPSVSPTATPSVKPLRQSYSGTRRPSFLPTFLASQGPLFFPSSIALVPVSQQPSLITSFPSLRYSTVIPTSSPRRRSRPALRAVH